VVVLSIPASSASDERILSSVMKTFRPEKNRLTDEKFEQQVSLNATSALYHGFSSLMK